MKVVDDDVEVSFRQTVFEFNFGGVQAFLKTLLGFCVSVSQALFELFDGWWLDEHEDWIEMRISDLFDAFDFNVKYTNFALLLHVLDRFFAKNSEIVCK
jgi:hypothetical protein